MADDPVLLPRKPEVIERFLENVRGTIPLSIEQIGNVLRLIAAAVPAVRSYLDLGGTSGMLTAAVLQEYPSAEAVLLHHSGQHLAALRPQLGACAERAAFRPAHFETPDWRHEAAPLTPYDLITSGVELRMLPEQRQRVFFREIYEVLRPGGFFLTVQYVASATRWTESPWDDQMIETFFGDCIREGGKRPRVEVARAWYDRRDPESRHVAPLEVQCDWLREIGYESVECYLKVSELAVFGGLKPDGEPS